MSAKKQTKSSDNFEPIKKLILDNRISHKEIADLSNIDYPLFSFRHLRLNSIKKCADPQFFISFLTQLRDLSNIGWASIRQSGRHDYGMEPIPRNQIKADLSSLSDIITPEVRKLDVFRADKDNHVFVGRQVGKVFHVFFIEAKFGDIYDH